MDIIFLRGVALQTWLGVYDWEKQRPTRVLLDLEIALPHRAAASSDDLADTIDYAALLARLRSVFATQKFALLEALAEAIAALILQEFGAPWLRLSIEKPGILPQVAHVGLRIERGCKTQD